MALGNGITTTISGSAGNLTFRTHGEEQVITGRIQRMKNPKTPLQMNQRIKFPNLVSTYRAFHGLLKEGLEKGYKGTRDKELSPFNRFMSMNLQSRPVYLTRRESMAGYCIAAPYQITEGTLVPVRTGGVGMESYSDIALGAMELTDETTVAQFAKAVVGHNRLYAYGDVIFYFSVLQCVEAETGRAYVRVNRYRVVLDAADHSLLWGTVPAFGFSVSGGFLAHGEPVGPGAFAWVHARQGTAGWLVSSQRLVVANGLFEVYSGRRAQEVALRTYGARAIALAPE